MTGWHTWRLQVPHRRQGIMVMRWLKCDQSSALANLHGELARMSDHMGTQVLIANRLKVAFNLDIGL